jgi:predicted AAA+ superfamily ATPase
MIRSVTAMIEKDMPGKMVFLVGPRQVGKTWLAKSLTKKYKTAAYLNYDSSADRKMIRSESWLPSSDLVVLDEIHKMPKWKNYLKGVFDTKRESLRLLVTGSARLDTFRKGGDSMAGRFFTHRLFPFTPAELAGTEYDGCIDRLLERGGFPEPFLSDEEDFHNRWRRQYLDGLIRNDILDFENVHDLKAIQTVFELLRERVGSPVSLSSIARDVSISPNTVKRYLQIFEDLYIVFRVRPFSRNIARSLLKEPKIYFFDTGLVKGDSGVKFENLTALSLYSRICSRQDIKGENVDLCYIRTKEGREVDFCVTKDNTCESLVEAKFSDDSVSKQLRYFTQKLNVPGVQCVKDLRREFRDGLVEVRDAGSYLKEL